MTHIAHKTYTPAHHTHDVHVHTCITHMMYTCTHTHTHTYSYAHTHTVNHTGAPNEAVGENPAEERRGGEEEEGAGGEEAA